MMPVLGPASAPSPFDSNRCGQCNPPGFLRDDVQGGYLPQCDRQKARAQDTERDRDGELRPHPTVGGGPEHASGRATDEWQNGRSRGCSHLRPKAVRRLPSVAVEAMTALDGAGRVPKILI